MADSNLLLAQSISVGAKITPLVLAAPKVNNPSEAAIYGDRRFSYNFGAYFNYYSKKSWGLRTSLDFGSIPFDITVSAPVNAFGSGQGTGIFSLYQILEAYKYNAFTPSLLYKIPFKKNYLELAAGPSFRYYYHGLDSNGFTLRINTTPNSQLNQPSVNLAINPTGRKVQVTFPVAINYAWHVSGKSSLLFGVTKEFALQPIEKGNLTVNTYGKVYKGEFSPRAAYWGLNVQYQYNLAKLVKQSTATYKRTEQLTDSTRYRKAFFTELFGNGINLTGNYDMRFNRNRNDGLGFRAGIGSGSFYFTQDNYYRYITLPLSLNYIIGRQRSGLESGIGITPQYAAEHITDAHKFSFDTFFNLGYRYQPLKNGLMFRAMWTPSFEGSYGFYAGQYGISAGYSFK